MRASPDRSLLDDFIRKTLKNSDDLFTPFDWNELDVLLKHEQRTIPVEISKKNLFLIGGAVGGLLILFIIFKIVSHYSSLPDDKEPVVDSTQQILLHADPLSDITLQSDSLRKDTLSALPTGDTAISSKIILHADSAGSQKVSIPVAGTIPALLKKEKKKKNDSLPGNTAADTVSIRKEAPPALIDTSFRPAIKEIGTEPVPASDTTSKMLPSGNAKKKRSKEKKTPPPPAAPKTDMPIVQPDTL